MPRPDDHRYRLFEVARHRAELSVEQLWMRYLALSGTRDVFELDAYLNGVTVWTDLEQNVLACALNERLDDLFQASRIPYLTLPPLPGGPEDPLAVLDELASEQRRSPRWAEEDC